MILDAWLSPVLSFVGSSPGVSTLETPLFSCSIDVFLRAFARLQSYWPLVFRACADDSGAVMGSLEVLKAMRAVFIMTSTYAGFKVTIKRTKHHIVELYSDKYPSG